MIFTPTPLAGAYVIEAELREDERGFFARTYCEREFKEHALEHQFCQGNIAFNKTRGITRGMHYQSGADAEVKLVRCTRGSVFDAIVDLREGSATRYQWFGVLLSAENQKQLYVPKGFAHGYQVLQDESELSYLVSAFYSPGAEAGIRWNDPAVGIEWPMTEGIQLSDKDKMWDTL